jgi:aldehyde dehydrogenase (NAD+)
VLVDERVRAPFLEKLKTSIAALGDASRGIIVNERHAARIRRLFESAVEQGAEVVTGGSFRGREIAPTVLTNVAPHAGVMQEEIFGPILPVLSYRSLDEAFSAIAAKEKPLVLYIFSRDRRVVKRILAGTTAGGTAVNHALVHFYQLNLPFGGVGHSGVGKAHGYYGFEAFSNIRGVLDQRLRFSPIEMLYPPYRGKLKEKLIDFTVKWL